MSLSHQYLLHLSNNPSSNLTVKFKHFSFPFCKPYSTNLIVQTKGIIRSFENYKPEQASDILAKLKLTLPDNFVIGNSLYIKKLVTNSLLGNQRLIMKTIGLEDVEFNKNLAVFIKPILKSLSCTAFMVTDNEIDYIGIKFPTFNNCLSHQLTFFLNSFIGYYLTNVNIVDITV